MITEADFIDSMKLEQLQHDYEALQQRLNDVTAAYAHLWACYVLEIKTAKKE